MLDLLPPRQHRPRVRPPPPHPPGPRHGPRHCSQGRGTPPLGPVFLSSGLFCSLSALPLAGPRRAGGWVSLSPCPRSPRAGASVSVQSQGRASWEAPAVPLRLQRARTPPAGAPAPHLLPGLALRKSCRLDAGGEGGRECVEACPRSCTVQTRVATQAGPGFRGVLGPGSPASPLPCRCLGLPLSTS